MIWPLLWCFLLLLLAYRYVTRPRIRRHGLKLRRAPDALPIFGHGLQFTQPRNLLFDWFVQCQRQFGSETLEISVPTLPPGVVISDPSNLEFVLKNENAITKGNFVRSRSWDLFGNGIINATGETWKAQRKAGLKFFSGSNLDAMVDEILPEAWNRMKEQLDKHLKDESAVDMQSIFLDFTSFVMGHMAYDIELSSSHPFSQAFDYASDHIGRRFQNPLYQITELFTGSALYDALLEVKNFGIQIVAKAKQRRGKKAFASLLTYETPVFDTLIDSLLETFGDKPIVADAALNFLSAGKDTTAQSQTWTLYTVMRHPEVLPLLRAEVKDCIVSKKSVDGGMKWSAADLHPNNLPIMTATFYEALRLHPPIPFEIQQCQQDVTLPDGTFLPKSTVVVWCIWAINRATEIYGNDANNFRPSRWLDEMGRFKTRSAFEFPVFNGGPRACLGKRMAEIMALFVLASIISSYNICEDPPASADDAPRQSHNSLTLPMADGLPCRVNTVS